MRRLVLTVCATLFASGAARAADHVDITWMSITNVLFDFGPTRVLADGYITRLPESIFSGGGGVDVTSRPMRPDDSMIFKISYTLEKPPSRDSAWATSRVTTP